MDSLSNEPEKIGLAYFRWHATYITIGSLICAAILIGMTKFSPHSYVTPMWFIMPIMSWPFSLRTKIGKWWWSCWALATLFGAGAIHFSPHRISILCALIFGFSLGIGACLRWRPPFGVGNRRG